MAQEVTRGFSSPFQSEIDQITIEDNKRSKQLNLLRSGHENPLLKDNATRSRSIFPCLITYFWCFSYVFPLFYNFVVFVHTT